MKFSVPFLPEITYSQFLQKNIKHIHSIYYTLNTGPVLDARFRFLHTDFNQLNQMLQKFSGIKKYCLLNARFIHPTLYHDTEFLDRILDQMSRLNDCGNIDGIVFSDAYFLTALTDRNNEVSNHIEAVPGINCMIDSIEKAESFIDIIRTKKFKLPGKLILDRSLNRNLDQLEKISLAVKKAYPETKIELLANEGCIHHCPFKLAHDAQISLANFESIKNLTFLTNQTVGCHAYFLDNPETFLHSPFIRPEDTTHYDHLADTIKLCGRTLGPVFLTKMLTAYFNRSYNGNLFKLMDAAHWMADHYHLDNKRLDPGFLKMVTKCKTINGRHNQCRSAWKKAAKKKSIQIKKYKDIQ